MVEVFPDTVILYHIDLLMNETPDGIRRETESCVERGSPGGRFLLSGAGGLAPDTPVGHSKEMAGAMATRDDNSVGE